MTKRFIVPRHISILTIALILTTGIASADPKNKGKSFGHKKEPVSVGGSGKEKLTGPNPGRKPADVTVEYAKTIKDKLNVSDEDLSNLKVKDQYTDTHNGLTHLYLRQQIDGREVIDSDLASHLTRDGEIISISSTLVSGTQGAIGSNPTISAVDAATAAAVDLGLTITEPLQVLETRGGPEQETILTTGGIATEPIRAKLVYQPVAADEVRLAWNVDIDMIGGEHYWQIRVDATNAAVLAGDDLVDQDNWDGIVPDVSRNSIVSRAHTEALRPSVQASVNDGSGYNVFPIPLESPSDGPRSFVTNPAESMASPHGWHDTNGAVGAEFTITRGNNVHAYTDIDANNVPDPGSSPDGGAGLQFDFAYDPTLPPSANRPPAVVNLFYWNNIVHDVFYKYGFNEASGNFQINNYGRGVVNPATGLPEGQNDDVRAEAQDGSGTNNANFFTPVDGQRPRMQMFVWSYPFPNLVIVNAPSPIAGSYIATAAQFGPAVTLTGFNGDVVLAIDDAEPTSDGCTAFTNAAAVAGKIALVDRGNCNFSVKVHNAQLAGATGVIVGNNVPGNPITMGFTPPIPTITISSVMVSLDAANQFKANLPFNALVRRNPAPSRDSDFDAGVIAHEYGHGISNRLTGGRTVVTCLNNQEQMGEGWSDWLGLVLTTDPSDTAATVRGIGTYVSFQPPDGRGIRPTPYTADTAVNPSTYDTIKTAAVPHGVGYVWATMLWDMYWNLVQKHGYNSNVYEPWNTGGNNLAIQLVMDGMKLQPCRPGFVDGRNAILAADVALTGGANQCEIWRAFVKRGLGLNAVQGASSSVADGTQDFTKYDSAAPVISNVSTNPAVLWPPNHQMVTVPVSYDVTDTCPGVVTTLSVTSNEPQLSNEQGDLPGDYEVVNNHTVRLRAERLGSGTGRVYTITITATDPDGNSSSTTTTVTAPHDQRR